MILVTGGTGMIGAHLLLACAKDKLSTLALYRWESSIEKVAEFFKVMAPKNPEYFDSIQWHQSDLTDLVQLEKIFPNVTEVYHCAAKVSFAQYHTEKLIKTNIEGTANLVNLALKYKIRKFGYLSSVTALGVESAVKLVNEEHLWNSNEIHTPYAYSKYGAELEVWRGSQEGLEVVIVNPGIVLGSPFLNRSSGTLIKRIAKGMNFYPIGNAGIVDVDDVVDVLVGLMKSSIKNQRFILVAENIKYKDLIQRMAKALEVKSAKLALSKPLLYSLYILDKIAYALGLKKSFLNQATIKSLCSLQKYDGSKIERSLDFNYKSTTETIEEIAAEYHSNP
tara:strand:+ start:818 stop:1825 length:1008 start_codon:yes stop_codon:yes gene_type:complete